MSSPFLTVSQCREKFADCTNKENGAVAKIRSPLDKAAKEHVAMTRFVRPHISESETLPRDCAHLFRVAHAMLVMALRVLRALQGRARDRVAPPYPRELTVLPRAVVTQEILAVPGWHASDEAFSPFLGPSAVPGARAGTLNGSQSGQRV